MERSVRVVVGGGVAAAAAAGGLHVGDFNLRDAVRIARGVRGAPLLLSLDLRRPLRPETGGLAALRARGRPTLREVGDALAWAAADARVVGLVGRIAAPPGGLATVQELAAAVRGFVASGKPAIAQAETLGDGFNGTLPYVLASAFGEVHVQPMAELALLGVAGEVTFLRGALDKAGIDPQIEQRHEYKSAGDILTEREFTAAHREALSSVVDSWDDQMVTAIAMARHLDASAVRAAINRSPLTPAEAQEHGLVDRVCYHDETLAALRQRVPGDAQLLPLGDYHARALPRHRWRSRQAPVIGVIDAEGPITTQGPRGPLSGPIVTSDAIGRALRLAADDDDIAAIVLRVDSPGGSAVASDVIHREVRRTRGAGTPVVAWMGDVAGSGGYYIAMAADTIVAQPGTLTGSIGVVSGKTVSAGLQHKLGLHTDAVTSADHARFYSPSSAYSASERERLDVQLDRIYDEFTAKVAQDRGLAPSRVDEVARGRIWTGAQAQTRGLVDRLGGYHDALRATRDVLGLPDDAPLRVHRYPPRPTPLARLRRTAPADPAERDILAARIPQPDDLAGWLDIAQAAIRPPGNLVMPWVPRIG